jgi:hypothetical protein
MSRRKPSVVRVAMAKRIAEAWLKDHAKPEYRLTVYAGSEDMRNLPGLLRAFRDSRTRIGSMTPIEDLGIQSGFDRVTLRSSDHIGMIELDRWLTKRGCETTGIW